MGGAKNTTTLFIKEALQIRLTNLELINKDEGITILGVLETGPGPCHDDELYPRHAMPKN